MCQEVIDTAFEDPLEEDEDITNFEEEIINEINYVENSS